jgi:hypothetical protein
LRFINDVPKLNNVASKDATTPTLMDAHLDTELGELQATDTYVAVRIPVEVEKTDTSGPVAIAELTAAAKAKAPALKIPKRPKAKKDQPGPYPKLAAIWPDADAIKKPAFKVGINANYLKAVADALGAKTGMVELIFPADKGDGWPNPMRAIVVHATKDFQKPGDDGEVAEALLRPIVVEPLEEADTNPEGLVMPIRVADAVTSPPKGKKPSGKDAKSTAAKPADDSGLTPAQKAWQTRKANADAADKGKSAIADQVKAVAGTKPVKTSGRAATKPNGNGNGNGSRSDAANKAHETRRQIQEIAAKLQKRNKKLSEKDAINQARVQLGLKPTKA